MSEKFDFADLILDIGAFRYQKLFGSFIKCVFTLMAF